MGRVQNKWKSMEPNGKMFCFHLLVVKKKSPTFILISACACQILKDYYFIIIISDLLFSYTESSFALALLLRTS